MWDIPIFAHYLSMRHWVNEKIFTSWSLPLTSFLAVGSTVELGWDCTRVKKGFWVNERYHLIGRFIIELVLNALRRPFWAHTDASSWDSSLATMALVKNYLWRLKGLLGSVRLPVSCAHILRMHKILYRSPCNISSSGIILAVQGLLVLSLHPVILSLLSSQCEVLWEKVVVFQL